LSFRLDGTLAPRFTKNWRLDVSFVDALSNLYTTSCLTVGHFPDARRRRSGTQSVQSTNVVTHDVAETTRWVKERCRWPVDRRSKGSLLLLGDARGYHWRISLAASLFCWSGLRSWSRVSRHRQRPLESCESTATLSRRS